VQQYFLTLGAGYPICAIGGCKRLYSESKLELNWKKFKLEWCKINSVCVFNIYCIKDKLQILKFEFCQIKLG